MTARRGVTEEAAVAAIESACRLLRLPTIRSRFAEIATDSQREQLSYLGFLAELVMVECENRDKRSSARRIAAAGFPRTKILADFDFAANPAIPAAVVNQLATGAWVKAGQPLCLIGDSGTGKSHLLIALGTAAAQQGYRVRYTLTSKLVNELVEAADEKQLSKTIARYGRVDLLCLDELGFLELDRKGAELLFQVLTEREEKSAVAIASNEAFSGLDEDVHRPQALRRHRRPPHLQRTDHRNRHHQLPTGTIARRRPLDRRRVIESGACPASRAIPNPGAAPRADSRRQADSPRFEVATLRLAPRRPLDPEIAAPQRRP